MPKRNPHHSFALDELLAIGTNGKPKDFDAFWQHKHQQAMETSVEFHVQRSAIDHADWQILEVNYHTTNQLWLFAWLLLPKKQAAQRALVVTHGYSGRHEPDLNLPFKDAAIFQPCIRGLGRSWSPPISNEANWHVLHDIDKKDRYIIGGCVQDIWTGMNVVASLLPHLADNMGYLGISFGGGLGVFATAYDARITAMHINVPTFGDYKKRLQYATFGSGLAVQEFNKRHPEIVAATMPYYDAAFAAKAIKVPVHCALALKDHMVTPIGQFAIYNALKTKKGLNVLTAGHCEYPEQAEEGKRLMQQLQEFFSKS